MDIIVVEDDEKMGTLLCDFLKKENYSVALCHDGKTALDLFLQNKPKLIVLDIMIPNIDGLVLCGKIRETSNVPIIIVSAKTGKDDKLKSLDLGADDYIEKPYDIDILLAKIKGIFARRYCVDVFIDNDIKIDKRRRIVYKNGDEIAMTQKEFELLVLLAENSKKAINKDYIFNKIWGFESESEAQTLTVHIKRLREKIEDNPKNPKRILTVWGIGYRYEPKE